MTMLLKDLEWGLKGCAGMVVQLGVEGVGVAVVCVVELVTPQTVVTTDTEPPPPQLPPTHSLQGNPYRRRL